MKGGNYSSGSSYGMYVAGTSDAQWDRTMDQTGQYGRIPGNTLIGVQGQNIPPQSHLPTNEQLSLVQRAGKRHRSRKSHRSRKNKKGGFLGAVVSQAAVPFSLLGIQQTYKPKKHKRYHKTKSRRR
jgi:hypothetical protein